MISTKKNKIVGYLFIAPVLILFTIFFFVPIVQAVKDSFYSWNGISNKTFNGLDNYAYIFNSENFTGSIKNNIIMMLSSIFIQIPIALLIAVVLSTQFKGYKFFRTIYFIPCVISTVVIGMIWSFVYNPYFGILNSFLKSVHLDFLIMDWLGNRKIAFYSVIVVSIWQWIGYIMVILLAGLNNISQEVIEASTIDGANSLKKLIYVTIPMMWGYIEVCILLAITGSMKALDLVYIMTYGGPGSSTEVMATYMWKISFISSKFGPGQAVAVVILTLSILLTVIFKKFTSTDTLNESGGIL